MGESIERAPSAPAPDRLAWTLAQRRALWLILACLCVLLVARHLSNRRYVADPPPEQAPRADELADRLDPNAADWQDLAAIPSLGEKRAQAIVAYRQGRQRHPGEVVFRSADDLMLVRGIGYSMATKLKPYLLFPPTTRP